MTEPTPQAPRLAAPELAAVEVHGMTRAAFVMRGALALGAGAGTAAVGPFVARALAQGETADAAVLDFALTLELLEAEFYRRALKEVRGLSDEVRRVTVVLRDHEEEHAEVISKTLRQLAVRPSDPPQLDFGGAFRSERSYLALSQTLEDTGVAAYNGAAPDIVSRRVLAAAGAIVQVEARHAAVIRSLRGEEITPGAFDKAATMDAIQSRVDPYLR